MSNVLHRQFETQFLNIVVILLDITALLYSIKLNVEEEEKIVGFQKSFLVLLFCDTNGWYLQPYEKVHHTIKPLVQPALAAIT